MRRVCVATGYMGDPIAWQWRDPESFADLFTAHYTDREPESSMVAELDGRVVGYLLGCRDSAAVASRAGMSLSCCMLMNQHSAPASQSATGMR